LPRLRGRERGLENPLYVAMVLSILILLASMISVELGVTVAVVEIALGVVAGNALGIDLEGLLKAAGLPLRTLSDLKKAADKAVDTPRPAEVSYRNVAVVEYRDGTLIDVVQQVAG
jgi:citrate lyase subunit alpha/citrate CoA-transferase